MYWKGFPHDLCIFSCFVYLYSLPIEFLTNYWLFFCIPLVDFSCSIFFFFIVIVIHVARSLKGSLILIITCSTKWKNDMKYNKFISKHDLEFAKLKRNHEKYVLQATFFMRVSYVFGNGQFTIILFIASINYLHNNLLRFRLFLAIEINCSSYLINRLYHKKRKR